MVHAFTGKEGGVCCGYGVSIIRLKYSAFVTGTGTR